MKKLGSIFIICIFVVGVFAQPTIKTVKFEDGTYEGEVNSANLPNGKGKFISENLIYEGTFINGKLNGKGKLIWKSGGRYEGDFVNGLRTGKGKYFWKDGGIYEGDFLSNQRTGKGIMTYPNRNIYEGNFFNGKRNGYGKLVETDGKISEGNWKDDEFLGKPTQNSSASTNKSLQSNISANCNSLAECGQMLETAKQRIQADPYNYKVFTEAEAIHRKKRSFATVSDETNYRNFILDFYNKNPSSMCALYFSYNYDSIPIKDEYNHPKLKFLTNSFIENSGKKASVCDILIIKKLGSTLSGFNKFFKELDAQIKLGKYKVVDSGDAFYKGTVDEKGFPKGKGIFYNPKQCRQYLGDFSNGQFHGKGILINSCFYKNQNGWETGTFKRYEGDFVDYQITGYGTYEAVGFTYVGQIESGNPNGKGKIFIGRGSREGVFMGSKCIRDCKDFDKDGKPIY